MAKLYSGGYGHNPSTDKLYTYWGGDNYKVGQNVNVPVTNKHTGRTYNTMFTIYKTTGAQTDEAGRTAFDLEARKGVDIKWINGSDVSSLPSYDQYGSKAEWERSSYKKWAEPQIQDWLSKAQMRLGEFTPQTNNAEAINRLITGV